MKINKLFLTISMILCFMSTANAGSIFDEIEREKKIIILETTQGTIKLQLYPDQAPKACENFIALTEQGYYDGTIFHRVVKNYTIQGGDPTGTGTGGTSIWGKPFENEIADLRFSRPGMLAMANAGPNTNGSQFCITTRPVPEKDGQYTIFGEVIEGYDVVEKIENVPVDPSKNHRPLTEQKIIKAYLRKM